MEIMIGIASGCIALVALVVYWWWIEPALTEWWAQRFVARLLEDFKNGKRPPPKEYPCAILFDSTGFVVKQMVGNDHPPIKLRWSDVRRVVAFKRDELTVDRICVCIEDKNGKELELNEDLADWLTFLESLPDHLPACKPFSVWFQEVAFPAFATNQTILFESGDRSRSSAAPNTDALP
jgi:hypothetical protein